MTYIERMVLLIVEIRLIYTNVPRTLIDELYPYIMKQFGESENGEKSKFTVDYRQIR